MHVHADPACPRREGARASQARNFHSTWRQAGTRQGIDGIQLTIPV